MGQVVRLESGPRRAGIHTVRWGGTDDRGSLVATGVYLVRLSAQKAQSRLDV